MSSQQWGQAPQRPGPNPWSQQGYPSGGFGQPSYGPPQYGRPPAPGYAPQGGRPSFGPGPQRPQRQRNPLRVLLFALIGVAAVALVALVVTNLGTSDSSDETAYQNDSYQVPPPDLNPPPLPLPDTYEEAEQIITASPFYSQTVPAPVRCEATPIDVASASDAQLKDHFNTALGCLVRVWEPPVTDAGLIIVRPSVTIYGASVTTKCGTARVNAFYCAADQQVYYSDKLADDVPIVAQDKWAADVVIAHEFGHALQARSGILISAKALGQQSGDDETDLLYSRRLETQADCFSGMYIRAVSRSLGIQQSDLAGIEATYRAVGDDTLSGDPDVDGNHGRAKSRLYWGDTGLGNSSVGKCNTFTAPASSVR